MPRCLGVAERRASWTVVMGDRFSRTRTNLRVSTSPHGSLLVRPIRPAAIVRRPSGVRPAGQISPDTDWIPGHAPRAGGAALGARPPLDSDAALLGAGWSGVPRRTPFADLRVRRCSTRASWACTSTWCTRSSVWSVLKRSSSAMASAAGCLRRLCFAAFCLAYQQRFLGAGADDCRRALRGRWRVSLSQSSWR